MRSTFLRFWVSHCELSNMAESGEEKAPSDLPSPQEDNVEFSAGLRRRGGEKAPTTASVYRDLRYPNLVKACAVVTTVQLTPSTFENFEIEVNRALREAYQVTVKDHIHGASASADVLAMNLRVSNTIPIPFPDDEAANFAIDRLGQQVTESLMKGRGSKTRD